jgi:nucleotide-binding universal stress UspA family protein
MAGTDLAMSLAYAIEARSAPFPDSLFMFIENRKNPMFNSILWPVDGSPLSLKPLDAVTNLARLTRAKVVVLSVAEPRLFRASDSDSIESGDTAETMQHDAASHIMNELRVAIKEAGINCETVVLLSADPSIQIVDTAQKMHCDLIVMATRGKMGVIDTVFGESTTQQVLQKSAVPLLILP